MLVYEASFFLVGVDMKYKLKRKNPIFPITSFASFFGGNLLAPQRSQPPSSPPYPEDKNA